MAICSPPLWMLPITSWIDAIIFMIKMLLLWLGNKEFCHPWGDKKLKVWYNGLAKYSKNCLIDIGKRVRGYWVVEGEGVYITSEGKEFSMWSLGAHQPLHFIEIGPSVGAINHTDWLLLHLMKSPFWIS